MAKIRGKYVEQGSLAKKISEFVEPSIEAMGLTLWGVEVTSANRPAVIIYIDGKDGVSIDQCAAVSRDVGLMLEVEEIIDSAYILEVSSPGLERKFSNRNNCPVTWAEKWMFPSFSLLKAAKNSKALLKKPMRKDSC